MKLEATVLFKRYRSVGVVICTAMSHEALSCEGASATFVHRRADALRIGGRTTGPVAQWIRHRPTEPGIAGSSPARVIFDVAHIAAACSRDV